MFRIVCSLLQQISKLQVSRNVSWYSSDSACSTLVIRRGGEVICGKRMLFIPSQMGILWIHTRQESQACKRPAKNTTSRF